MQLLWIWQLLALGFAFCPLNNCIKCTSTNINQACDVCELGYYLDKVTNTCLSCATHVTHCHRCSADGKKCYVCLDGRVLKSTKTKSGSIQECVLSQQSACEAIPNCGLCTATSGKTVCTACSPEYFLDTSGACISCSSNCVSCTSASTCYYCEDSYALSSGACTKAVISNCDICYDNSVCNTCSTGFHRKDDGTCTQTDQCDIAGCKECTQGTSTCTTCYRGYYQTSDRKCTLCSQASPNCIRCDDASSCTLCQHGFYLVSGGRCRSCSLVSEHCQECPGGICVACNPGYELMVSPRYCKRKTTSDCLNLKHCLKCTTESQCIGCEPGYSPKNGQCDLYTGCGVSNCGICKISPDTCDICIRGYRLENGTCVLKCTDRNCQTCTQDINGYEECQQCIPGHVLDTATGKCASCGIADCIVCHVSEGTRSTLSAWRRICKISLRKWTNNQKEAQNGKKHEMPRDMQYWDEKLKKVGHYYRLTDAQLNNLRVTLYDFFSGGTFSAHLFNDSTAIRDEIDRVYSNLRTWSRAKVKEAAKSYICTACAEGYSLTHNSCVKQVLTTSNIIGITAGVVIAVGIVAGIVVMMVLNKKHKSL